MNLQPIMIAPKKQYQFIMSLYYIGGVSTRNEITIESIASLMLLMVPLNEVKADSTLARLDWISSASFESA